MRALLALGCFFLAGAAEASHRCLGCSPASGHPATWEREDWLFFLGVVLFWVAAVAIVEWLDDRGTPSEEDRHGPGPGEHG